MGTELGNCCGQLFKLFSRELHVFVSKLISQATTTYLNYKYQTETASFPFRLFLRILVKGAGFDYTSWHYRGFQHYRRVTYVGTGEMARCRRRRVCLPRCKGDASVKLREAVHSLVLCVAFVGGWSVLLGLPRAVAAPLVAALPKYWYLGLPSLLLSDWEYTPLLAWALSYLARLWSLLRVTDIRMFW